jgi:tetratricopeptide (TPR) repeat protein
MRPSSMLGLFAAPFVLCAAPAPAGAQEHAHHGTERLGRVVFPVSCNAQARQGFERAMALLHSFWWEEGERAFQAVAAADSTCAMAYWGLALTYWNNPFAGGPAGPAVGKGVQAAERAQALGGGTPRERGFIAAAGALYRGADQTPNAARLQAYADTMARLYRDHPTETEVAIYYAQSLVATAPKTDTTFANQKRAAAILNPLYAQHPDHPGLAHYIIHANDTPRLATLGLEAARRYALIAPSAPHAQHMPSHIFVRLGLWDETVASNWKSYEAGVEYARVQKLAGVASHEFHALDYAVYGYLQRGMDSAARRTVALAESISNVRVLNSLVGGYNRTAMEARIPLERGDWKAAAAFPLRGAADFPVVAALSHFTRGVGAARSGDAARAQVEAQALDSIARVLAARPEPYWARVVGIKHQSVLAWAKFAAGDTVGALAEARAAADAEDVTEKHPVTPGELLPARELEADMHLAAGHYAAARAAYLATLTREPGRARALYGVARAAELAGDRVAATAAYQEFLKMLEKSDGDRAELIAARAFVGQGSH